MQLRGINEQTEDGETIIYKDPSWAEVMPQDDSAGGPSGKQRDKVRQK